LFSKKQSGASGKLSRPFAADIEQFAKGFFFFAGCRKTKLRNN